MKRKIYSSGYERKHDQRIGAVAFIVVNVIVYLVYRWLSNWPSPADVDPRIVFRLRSAIQLLPWVVNGAVLVWVFIFRPQIGIGYITCFGAILAACVMLGSILVASCFISLVVGFPLMGAFGNDVGELFFVLALIGSLLAGLIWFVVVGWRIAVKWWWEDG